MSIPSGLRAWCVTATVVLTAVAVSGGALNAFEPVKLLVVCAGAAASLAALWLSGGQAVPWMKERRVPLIAAGVVVGVIAIAAVIASADPVASLVGSRTRWGGLLLYAACAGLLVVAATLGRSGIRWVLTGIAVAGGLVAAAGVLQWLGAPILDGIGSQVGYPSTLGNINFAAGYVGASAGAMAWMALDGGFDRIVRGAGAALLVLAIAYVLVSTSFQGVPTLGAAVGVVALHRAWTEGGVWRRAGVPVAGVVALLAGVLVIAGVLQTGPLSGLGAEEGVELRRGYWGAAVGMIADNPVLGVGPEQYIYDFRQQRSYRAADATEVSESQDELFDQSALLENDAAHNIFLHHGASGGLLLLAAFVGLVTTVVVAAIRGYRRPGVDTASLSGAVGVLAGYLTQGLVSIDVAALASLGWIAMGLVVAAATQVVVEPTGKTRGRKAKRPTRTRPVTTGWPRLAVAGLFVVAVAVVAGQPLRAESRALSGLRQSSDEARTEGAQQAAAIGRWDPRYGELFGLSLLQEDAGEGVTVLDGLYDQGVLTGSAAIRVARQFAEQDPVVAATWYDRALGIDPRHPELRLEAAQFYADHDQRDRARTLVADLLQDDPENADAKALSEDL